ncbi:hypothetical protein FZEAL_274 [Fusarium zealandicum]|uniref:Six-hairpin glycosidase n=1 Tax=Fusarium zealandicum TaxID=1053134 RepID=A0A8H4XQL3_9HYPO|nr:hypothetical protein FZEAL_274 [Fusarium zealandicum]
MFLLVFLGGYFASVFAAASSIRTAEFQLEIDDDTGALVELSDPKADGYMNWVSAESNAPWQPTGSRWGLGFADIGESSLHKYFWNSPESPTCTGSSCTVTYLSDSLQVQVIRSVDKEKGLLTEQYAFKNIGSTELELASRGDTSFAIYTPFNDHYTNTTDALKARAHAHIWANGGSNAWVKMNQMGSNGRDLGLVLTKGALAGYSVESRDSVTSSNTRGVFLLHPIAPVLQPEEETVVEWTLFWHDGWDDFFEQCAQHSSQFINFGIPSYTLVKGENAVINITGALVDETTTVDGKKVACGSSMCTYNYTAKSFGEKRLRTSTRQEERQMNSTIFLNVVPEYDDLISSRVKFIMENQQIESSNATFDGAYVLYDNQMEGQVTFDARSDRNTGRERIGMGILFARWLAKNPDKSVQASFEKYYNFVCSQLQDDQGYVLNGPGNRGKRLYNWPWMMHFHLVTAALDLNLTGPVAEKSPIERFMLTIENFYSEGGESLYAIGLPILEGLRALNASGDEAAYERALDLFTRHGEYIAERGRDYPAFEVNFEQSIIAPAANMLLELYRWTKEDRWLEAAKIQFDTLLRFSGKQPDYHLYDVAIRHWDGYWFGKDRMWADTFPHHWSTLNALALHHYGKAVGDSRYEKEADGVIRANLALFSPDGRGHCAWLYPLSVNGRQGHYPDPYANDQDWALAHLLQIESDNSVEE